MEYILIFERNLIPLFKEKLVKSYKKMEFMGKKTHLDININDPNKKGTYLNLIEYLGAMQEYEVDDPMMILAKKKYKDPIFIYVSTNEESLAESVFKLMEQHNMDFLLDKNV